MLVIQLRTDETMSHASYAQPLHRYFLTTILRRQGSVVSDGLVETRQIKVASTRLRIARLRYVQRVIEDGRCVMSVKQEGWILLLCCRLHRPNSFDYKIAYSPIAGPPHYSSHEPEGL